MKKVYEKPAIIFESFASSVNIAGDCEVRTNTANQGNCGIPGWVMGSVLFLDHDESLCTGFGRVELDTKYSWLDGSVSGYDDGYDIYDQLCYNTPSGDNLFNS